MDVRILSAKIEQEDWRKRAGALAVKFALPLQQPVWDAFEAADNNDYEKAIKLCCRILDADDSEPEIRLLLGCCYFAQGNVTAAHTVFHDLTVDCPEEEEAHLYLGITCHALGDMETARDELERIYPPDKYHPFYRTTYGDALQRLGKKQRARDIFREEIDLYEMTGFCPSDGMLDGAFENLLYLDVVLGNGKYPEDLESYCRFLDAAEMTDEMQRHLAGNIVYFCGLMNNKWYRPLFLEFITHIREKNYLSDQGCVEILNSAFSAWESWKYREDYRISSVVEDYLGSVHQAKYFEASIGLEEEKRKIRLKALTYEWYICRYYPEHPEEFLYVRNTYPHTWKNCGGFLEEVQADAQKAAQDRLDKLAAFSEDVTKAELESFLQSAYQKALSKKKEAVFISDSDAPYRRMQPKVGRNDPCPCGSGKKYKKCCGRQA